MSKYLDIRGRLHDKPVTPNNQFPCNNANLYSAYAVKCGIYLMLDKHTLLICSHDFVRHLKADKPDAPPTSRDEILGLSYLGYTSDILAHNWRFNSAEYPIPKLSISKLITQALALLIIIPYYKRILGIDVKLWHIELAHRNFFWKNNLDQLYRFAFSVPLQDRYSILKWSGRFKYYLPSHLFYASISLIDRLGKPSGIRYLKYGGEKNMREMVGEFPQDHPIRVKVGM